MLKALTSCSGHPTVIVTLEDMQADLMRFAYKLFAMLGRAGVSGLQMPGLGPLRRRFGGFLKAARVRSPASSRPREHLTKSQVRLAEVDSCLPGLRSMRNHRLMRRRKQRE